jgi:hypothetical protein
MLSQPRRSHSEHTLQWEHKKLVLTSRLVRILHVPLLWEHANSINRMKSVVIPRHFDIKTMQIVLHRHDTTNSLLHTNQEIAIYCPFFTGHMSTIGNYPISWKGSNIY